MKNLLQFVMAVLLITAIFLSESVFAAKHVINVQNYSFSPANLSGVIVGDTIRWVWVSGSHTTTSTSIPTLAAAWNSPITSTVTSFEYKVTTPGTYNYKCTPHASMGMVGVFTVSPAPTLTVTPENQNVPYAAGTTSFDVVSNSNWTASCDRGWCTVTPSGSGSGTLTAEYSENTTSAVRIATINVSVSGLPSFPVTVTQDMSSLSVNVEKAAQLRIYPNPTHGKFSLILDKSAEKPVDFKISDVLGNVLYRQQGEGKEKYDFDVSDFRSGIYYLVVDTAGSSKALKFLLVE